MTKINNKYNHHIHVFSVVLVSTIITLFVGWGLTDDGELEMFKVLMLILLHGSMTFIGTHLIITEKFTKRLDILFQRILDVKKGKAKLFTVTSKDTWDTEFYVLLNDIIMNMNMYYEQIDSYMKKNNEMCLENLELKKKIIETRERVREAELSTEYAAQKLIKAKNEIMDLKASS